MAGLDKILSEISAEADAGVQEILDDAKKEADQIRAEADREAGEAAERFTREAEKRAADRKSRAVSAAALKKRQLLLAKKQELISGGLNKAREKLLAMPDAAYFDAMIKLVEKNALDQPGEIRFNSRDLARLPQDYATRIENAAFKHGGRLALSKSAADIDGGFLLIYEGIEQNCSVAALFETNAEELSDKIQKMLF